jgi:hypothetical protein
VLNPSDSIDEGQQVRVTQQSAPAPATTAKPAETH